MSIGNKADVSTNDLLEWWEDEAATEAILLYVESFGNPRRFARIARRVARRKPILALKSGRSKSGQRAASSHTAALAGSDAAADALFRQAGVIRAETLEELVDVASLFSAGGRLDGRSVGIVTNAGGLGILCADACEAAGLELPALGDDTVTALRAVLPAEASVANPVDMLGGATAATYAAVLPHVLADPHVSACVVLFVPAVSATAEEVADAVVDAVAEAGSDKPVLAVIMSSDGTPAALRGAHRVASFAYPESAARALGRVADRASWLRRPQGAVPPLDGIERARAEAVVEGALKSSDDTWLDPAATRELLDAYGLPLVPERVATSVDEAIAAALELGFPVVVKTAAPGAHKTETGGIALDLADEEAVAAAAATHRASRDRPADADGRRRAPRGRRPGSCLRAARRLRPRRRLRRADRRGRVPHRAAHRRRRRGARRRRQGGPSRRGLPRCLRRRPGVARRPRPPARPARRGPPGRGRARSQSGARAPRPLRRRRRPHPCPTPDTVARAKTW